MKRRLFAVVMLVSIYVLFTIVFVAADSQGHVSQLFVKAGWSDNSEMTSSITQPGGAEDNETQLKTSFRRPMPKPPRPKPKPKPDVF